MLPAKFQVEWPFRLGEKAKIDFQDGGLLGFKIRMILAIFDLLVTLMLCTKFQVMWPFPSGEKAKIHFQDGSHFGFKIRMILAIFDLY